MNTLQQFISSIHRLDELNRYLSLLKVQGLTLGLAAKDDLDQIKAEMQEIKASLEKNPSKE